MRLPLQEFWSEQDDRMRPDSLVLIETPLPGAVLLTLNRPEALNALSVALCRELTATLARLSADEGVRVVVLTGSGRAFCAGLDLTDLSGVTGTELAALVTSPDFDVVAAVRRFPGVVVGAVNGFAVTGGFELALACDVLLASTDARFADTHGRVGVLPGWGLSQRLPRLIGALRAKELSLSCKFLDAAKAEAWGIVNRVVPPAELLPQALALAEDMLEVPPPILRSYKRVIDDGLAGTLDHGLRLERGRSEESFAALGPGALAARREAILTRGRARGGPTR
jgi:enoyl-CoA hydratase